MGRNDDVNNKIREAINDNKDTLILCKGLNDPSVVTYDGIIATGDKAPELLFLLKEANDGRDSKKKNKPSFEEGFDFIKNARMEAIEQNGVIPEHWDNLCYWTKAYQDAKNKIYHYFNHPTVLNCGGLLGEIAIVNIKKVPGSGVTDLKEFLVTVENEVCSKLVRDEITWIAPKIVVCCGTYEYARIMYKAHLNERMLECGLKYFCDNGICFLEFVHPTQYGLAARNSLLYVYAKEVFKNIIDVIG